MEAKLRIRAGKKKRGKFAWVFVDEEMKTLNVRPESIPADFDVKEGDVWIVGHVRTQKSRNQGGRDTSIVRLIEKERELLSWESVTSLPDHWVPPELLRSILCLIFRGKHIALVGEKGTGKTTMAFSIARIFNWPKPCKVDAYTIRKPADLFGSDAAANGSTVFQKSDLFHFIEKARESFEAGEEKIFIVILDEWNRCHPKQKQGMQGLLDKTRQVSFTCVEGSLVVKLPHNVVVMATMNKGGNYHGTFPVDDSDKDRFCAFHIQPMPLEVEEGWLVERIGIPKGVANKIVKVARALRASERISHLSYSPSYRGCDIAATLVKDGASLKRALIDGLFGWYDGDREFDEHGNVVDTNSEFAKAWEAATQNIAAAGLGQPRDVGIKEVA